MHYTLINTENVQLGQMLSIDKNGNKYDLWYEDGDRKELRTFDNLEDAYSVYEKINKAMVFGWFSYEDRVNILFDDLDSMECKKFFEKHYV